MKKGQLINIALIGFLVGVVVIVLLQVLSGRNINRLMQSNNKLLTELRLQKELRRIETDLVGLESDVRGAVISGDAVLLQQAAQTISGIGNQLADLKATLQLPHTNKDVLLLEKLVQAKVQLNQDVLQAVATGGKASGEAIINTGRGRQLRDSITSVLSYLDSAQHNETAFIASSIEANGRNARTWGFTLAAIACMLVTIAFWYIVGQSQQQQKIIRSLNESERKIKDAAQMKEQFMANMSHEIRTPMNAIIGFTALLRRTPLDATQREYVQNIHSAGDNLLALVNDILDLSKIEAGMMHLEETRFSLRSLAASVGAMFAEKVKEKGLQLRVEISDDVPDILSGDAVRLTQVLVNLVGNAVKFTDSGGVVLQARTRYLQQDKTGLCITVTDTGIGIPPEKQQTIFDRFQQAESTTARRYGGTGLGLSIVRQLAELQGGNVSVQSTSGQGSVFTVNIDYRIPHISEAESASLYADDIAVTPEALHILVAEDNAMNQQLMRHLMRNWGFTCTIVSNGAEAIAQLTQQSFLMVLMDIQMPEMDGYTTTAVIRNELKLDVPIVAMTAHAMMGEKEKCLQLGMNDYLSKPIKESELYNLVARYAQAAGRSQMEAERAEAAVAEEAAFEYLDLAYLRQLSGNDPAFEREMMLQFSTQVSEELQTLENAIAAADLPTVKSVAHSLKSTVGYMGLSSLLNPHLDAIEKSAKEGRSTGIAEAFVFVKEAAGATRHEIEQALLHEAKGSA